MASRFRGNDGSGRVAQGSPEGEVGRKVSRRGGEAGGQPQGLPLREGEGSAYARSAEVRVRTAARRDSRGSPAGAA